jgi:hypothetical protein
MAAVIAVLILVACLGLAFLPLVLTPGAESAAATGEDPLELLHGERRRLLDEIRDLDMDLTLGKVSEGDHATLRAGLESRVLTLLDEIGELEGGGEEE